MELIENACRAPFILLEEIWVVIIGDKYDPLVRSLAFLVLEVIPVDEDAHSMVFSHSRQTNLVKP